MDDLQGWAAAWAELEAGHWHGPLFKCLAPVGTTNNAQARPLGAATRAAEVGGGLWRATVRVGKTGRLPVEWGTTVEQTEWGACAGFTGPVAAFGPT